MGAQCLCHLLIAFSAMVEAMALCRRPEEEKEGQAANLELAGWEQRQHLVSLEERMESCCSSMETRANKRDNWRGKEDKSPHSLGGLQESNTRLNRGSALHGYTCDPAGTTASSVLDHGVYMQNTQNIHSHYVIRELLHIWAQLSKCNKLQTLKSTKRQKALTSSFNDH